MSARAEACAAGGALKWKITRRQRERLVNDIIDRLEYVDRVLTKEASDSRIAFVLRMTREAIGMVRDLPSFAAPYELAERLFVIIARLDSAKPVLMGEPGSGQFIFERRVLDHVTAALVELAALADNGFDAGRQRLENEIIDRQAISFPGRWSTLTELLAWLFKGCLFLALWGLAAWLAYSVAVGQGWLS